MFSSASTERHGIDTVEPLLKTPAPAISSSQARYVMSACYPGFTDCSPMAGERDTNFQLSSGHDSLVLKFINPAEQASETAMQVEVLKHLARQTDVAVPTHRAIHIQSWPADGTLSPGDIEGQSTMDWAEYTTPSESVRFRAYSFLEGRPGTELHASHAGAHALGAAAARLDSHLADFDHPAAHRDLLWDTRHTSRLRAIAAHTSGYCCDKELVNFLDTFEDRVFRHFSEMPHQVIHNDMSPSNFLVDSTGLKLTGILDFGDMVYAPRAAEAAIAASYLPGDSGTELHGAIQSLIQGYESVTPLLAIERRSITGLILARLAQRIIITSWRATAFPANSSYILRSRAKAIEAFTHIYHLWK